MLRHRLVLSYEALAEGLTADGLILRIMQHVPRAGETAREPCPRAATPEAVLRRLEWTVMRRLDGLLQGDYRTLFRGDGLDLADLREYQYHDDVRHIDWNVTARLQTPYVREYQRGPRSRRLVPARHEPVGRFRLAAAAQARGVRPNSSPCSRGC